MKAFALLVAATFVTPTALSACKPERKVKLVKPEDETAKKAERAARNEEALREEFEKRQAARENAPEPELDPNEPREKLELVWRMGQTKLDSTYQERADMIDKVKRMPYLSKEERKIIDPLVEKIANFGLGREPEELEKAPGEICALINDVRGPAEQLIETGEKELQVLADQTKELDAKQDAGGTVYQKTWDKLDDAKKRWSAPVLAGRHLLLMLRSVLDEAYVLADLGARRVQIKLRDCLKPIADKPINLDLTQEALEKVYKRSKWYRDLR